MKRSLLLCLLLLSGCSAPSQVASTPKPTLQPDQVDLATTVPANGNLAPGVLVYDSNGFLMGRVVNIDPTHTHRTGQPYPVFFSQNDDPKDLQWMPYKMFDGAVVVKR